MFELCENIPSVKSNEMVSASFRRRTALTQLQARLDSICTEIQTIEYTGDADNNARLDRLYQKKALLTETLARSAKVR